MELEIELNNYRCFPYSRPAKFTLRNGFTALIGTNNSGKSSLLRMLYEFRPLFASLANPHQGGFGSMLNLNPIGVGLGPSITDGNEIFHNQNVRDLHLNIRSVNEPGITQPPNEAREVRFTFDRNRKGWIAKIPSLYTLAQLNQANVQGTIAYEQGRPMSLSPIIEFCTTLSDTLYIPPFRNAINVGSSQPYFDMTVGQAFITEWREHKTGHLIERNVAILQLTEEIRRIFDFTSLEIEPSSDNTTLKVFINGRSFKLGELGAGIAQFILVLANAAIKRPSFILIDEPEQNLHPSLQIDFLTTLASYSKIGVVFATHSMGLARAVADRIYSLRRIEEGESEVKDFEATPRLSEFLGELGFAGYQEMGFDKILLVEGSTDVTTFQQFLRLYDKEHKVLVLQLGGSSLINEKCAAQLAELKRISENITAVVDSERAAAGAAIASDRQQFAQVCSDLKLNCHILDRRATENYFTDRAVKRIKGEKFRCLNVYEKLSEASPTWSKSENWRIAREMTADELSGTDLGRIIETL